MIKTWSLLFVFLLAGVYVIAESAEEEYEIQEPDESNMEIYRYNIQQSDSDFDSSSVEIPVVQKREVASTAPAEETDSKDNVEPPKLLLVDLIGKVEGSIVQSAVNIAQLLKRPKNNSEVASTAHVTEAAVTEPPKNKRAAESSSVNATENKDTVVNYVTTKKVTAEGDHKSHVVVDHIAVSNAKGGLTPLLSSLNFFVKEAPRLVANAAAAKSTAATKNDGSFSELKIITTENSLLSTTPKHTSVSSTEASSNKVESSSSSGEATDKTGASSVVPSTLSSTTLTSLEQTSATTTSTSTTTTTKNPIEQLKEVEDDLKEKVAEIEAEPIILSARV